jgi:hypothetical protein
MSFFPFRMNFAVLTSACRTCILYKLNLITLRDKPPSSNQWIPWESLNRSSSCCSRSAVGNNNNNNNGKLKMPLHFYTQAHNFVSDFFETNNDRMSSVPDWNCPEHELQSMLFERRFQFSFLVYLPSATMVKKIEKL